MLLVGVVCVLLPFVSANTEIRNFAATLSSVNLQLDVDTVLLPRTTTAHTLVRAPPGTQPCVPSAAGGCTHELWAILDLDAEHHAKYSLRLSWPGSMPTDFSMDIFDPADAAAGLLRNDAGAQEGQAQTRSKYVRIRAIDAGVRTPTSSYLFSYLYPFAPYAPNTSAISDPDSGTQEEEVHFFLTLDPLLLTLLPASLLPFLGVALTVLTLVGVFVLPRVQAGVAALVADVHAEMEMKERLKQE